jgi:hypothetical protein
MWEKDNIMKGSDKFLIGIVAGILLLIVISLVVVLTRPEPEYRNGGSPEVTVHNYLLALRLKEYERAYGYLSPRLTGYPKDAEAFADDIDNRYSSRFGHGDTTIDVQSADMRGNMATVEVLETSFSDGDLFSSGNYERRFDMELRHENGQWKLMGGDRYWTSCWEQAPSDNSYCW